MTHLGLLILVLLLEGELVGGYECGPRHADGGWASVVVASVVRNPRIVGGGIFRGSHWKPVHRPCRNTMDAAKRRLLRVGVEAAHHRRPTHRARRCQTSNKQTGAHGGRREAGALAVMGYGAKGSSPWADARCGQRGRGIPRFHSRRGAQHCTAIGSLHTSRTPGEQTTEAGCRRRAEGRGQKRQTGEAASAEGGFSRCSARVVAVSLL